MEFVCLAVDDDLHVAAGMGFGGRYDSQVVAVATERGNLGFGGSFGGFDHCEIGFATAFKSSLCLISYKTIALFFVFPGPFFFFNT
jgi:hypothetical protein